MGLGSAIESEHLWVFGANPNPTLQKGYKLPYRATEVLQESNPVAWFKWRLQGTATSQMYQG